MRTHKVVSCASYGGTGSSVISDYLLEFPIIHNTGDYEFRFLQDYGGVTTLEDCLVYNYHRLNSDIAIRNFIKYIDYQSGDIFSKRYEKYFKNNFKNASYCFINKLIDAKWPGYWEQYQVLSPSVIRFLKYKLYPRIIKLLSGNKHYLARYIPKSTMYFSNPSAEYFNQCVQEYLNDLFNIIDSENQYKYLYFDQIIPPTNIERYFKYFDDLKIIVVDRDPRDLFITNYFEWHEGWIPKDIDKFIAVYGGIRIKEKSEKLNENILKVKFEDTIYKYNEFTQSINEFLGLSKSEHVFPLRNFNPDKSIKNTRLWTKYKISHAILSKIEKELEEFCYPF